VAELLLARALGDWGLVRNLGRMGRKVLRLLWHRDGSRSWWDLCVLGRMVVRTHRVVRPLARHGVAVSRATEKLRMHSRLGNHVRLEPTSRIS
jgi:hypothetical protein